MVEDGVEDVRGGRGQGVGQGLQESVVLINQVMLIRLRSTAILPPHPAILTTTSHRQVVRRLACGLLLGLLLALLLPFLLVRLWISGKDLLENVRD